MMAKRRVVKRKKNIDGKMKSGDFMLVILTLILLIFGVMMVFSASYYFSINKYGDPYHYLKRDIVWAVAGIIAMTVCALIDYRVYEKLAPAAMVISVILLLLIFTPLGITRNNATRWLGIEMGSHSITIMPGEIAKIACIVFTAWYLSRDPDRIKSLRDGILPLVALCGLCGILIIKQPNLSTALTVCGIIVAMMFVAGMSWKYIAGVGALGIVSVAGLLKMAPDSEWVKRITSFFNPFDDPLGEGYQVVQGLMAFGTGGLFGTGLGKSIQKNLYLPEPQNDFILPIIAEELGFVGVIILMIVYMLLIWRGIHIAVNAKDMFGCLLAAGITIMLALQVIMNIAVVTSSMPPTGISLPFISYGGNSLLIFMGSMGVLLNISRHAAR